MKVQVWALTGLVSLLISLQAASAQSFNKAYKRLYRRQEWAAADAVFQRYRDHRKYAAAAKYFIVKNRLRSERSFPSLLDMNAALIGADSIWRKLPPRRARRLQKKIQVDTLSIQLLRMDVQRWAMAGIRASGTVTALDSMLDFWEKPLPALQPEFDSTRYQIVNTQLVSEEYDVMTDLVHRHLGWVKPANYKKSRQMYDQLWPAFQQKYSLCELDKYVKDHPNSFVARDCWKDEVRDLLCARNLAQLLDFESSNKWSALETVLLNVLFDEASKEPVLTLTAEQSRLLQDLKDRATLREQLRTGRARRDTTAVLESAIRYISTYAPRYSAFRLLEETLQFFAEEELFESGIQLLTAVRPFFPDSLPANCQSNFDFQKRVKPYIDGLLPVWEKTDLPVKETFLSAFNTGEGDEFSPVLDSAQTVLFFAASGRHDNLYGIDIFYSRKTALGWEAPAVVEILSGPGDQIPLSLTADGKTMLLQSNGVLHFTQLEKGAWKKPAPVSLSGLGLIGKGVLSADGKTMILEGAYTAGGVLNAPDMDLFISTRDASGRWSDPQALGSDINTDGHESNPYLSADGRQLYFTSTEYPGLGKSDVFVSNRSGKNWIMDWTRPLNMGKKINNIFTHAGFGHVSPNGRRIYFARYSRDREKGDLWMLDIED
jgi:hypothetical protein